MSRGWRRLAQAMVAALVLSIPAGAVSVDVAAGATTAHSAASHRSATHHHADKARHHGKARHHAKRHHARKGKLAVTKAAKKKRRPAPTPTATATPTPTPTVTATSTAAQLGQHVAFGAFASGYSGSGLQITQLEQSLGAHLAIASSFRGYGDIFPDSTQRAEAAAGHALLISWDMGDTAASRFSTWANGSHDAYLAQVAKAVADFGQPLYIRPWPEMNGDWSVFQPTADGAKTAGGTPAQFVAAWRHVVTFFRDHGATNARWVFNPTTDTYAETTDVRTVFPGAAYVDVLGLDGYNWGTGGVFQWRSFQNIYQTQYDRLVALDPGAPVWVCEFASKEPLENDGSPVDPTHSKAQWYRDLLSSTAFPAIRALVFFDIDKERDWRLASDAETLNVVASAVKAAAIRSL